MRLLTLGLLLALIAGCAQTLVFAPPSSSSSSSDPNDLFGPEAMRLHPIFTQVKDWTGTGKPDGVEAVLEFRDRFGDSTKASGAVIFELFGYREGFADHRGGRVGQPWAASLASPDAQKTHWRTEIGAYDFLLSAENVSVNGDYILTATFEPPSGKRLFAETAIIGQKKKTHTPPPAPMLGIPNE